MGALIAAWQRSWGCGPIDQWRSKIGDVGSEIVLACTHRVAIVTRQPAGRNDGHPHMSCCRQLTVKYMSNIQLCVNSERPRKKRWSTPISCPVTW